MSDADNETLSDIYAKEHQNTLELLVKLKQKAKTEEELQELIDFEKHLTEIKPNAKAIDAYNRLLEQPDVTSTKSNLVGFRGFKIRLNLFLFISAGLFVFSIFIAPRIAIPQGDSGHSVLWYQLLFTIVLTPILTGLVYRYQSLDKFISGMFFIFFPTLFWGLLGVRLVFIVTPIEMAEAVITQYDSHKTSKSDSCSVTIKSDTKFLENYVYPLPCRQDLKKHDKVIVRYGQNFMGIKADFEKN